LMNIDARILNEIFTNWIQQHIKMIKLVSFQGCKDSFSICKPINLIEHIESGQKL
jgi:hypothetical protein